MELNLLDETDMENFVKESINDQKIHWLTASAKMLEF